VVVAGDDEDAAVRRRAVGVAVLERVAGAVDAGALAVPHREDAFGVRSGSDSTRCVPSTAVAASSSLIAGRNLTPAASSRFAAFHACWSTMPSGEPR
jgi:hypothetical protein